MRGKDMRVVPYVLTDGITPAYAGKSPSSIKTESIKRDHPRLCGEKILSQETISEDIGSPPPMRGKATL